MFGNPDEGSSQWRVGLHREVEFGYPGVLLAAKASKRYQMLSSIRNRVRKINHVRYRHTSWPAPRNVSCTALMREWLVEASSHHAQLVLPDRHLSSYIHLPSCSSVLCKCNKLLYSTREKKIILTEPTSSWYPFYSPNLLRRPHGASFVTFGAKR